MMMRNVVLIAAFALFAVACADEPAATTIAPIDVPATTVPAASPTTVTDPPRTTTTAESTTTTTTAAPSKANSWIAVLASLAVDEYDEAGALEQMTAIRDDLQLTALDVDVLLSDEFASLNPGYWVVHLGGFRDEWQADQACASVESVIPDCYTRHLALITADQAIGYDYGYILAVLDTGQLAVIDAGSGDIVRTIDDVYYGDGSYPGRPAITADGRTVYYSIGFEDFWFSCDASDGTLVTRSLGPDRPVQIADGFSPAISPDGRTLLYLASSGCLEDPNEAQFYIAPIDTIVLRSVASGEESRELLPLDGDIADYYEYTGAVWGADGDVYLIDSDARLFRNIASGGLEEVADLEHHSLLVGYWASEDAIVVQQQTFIDDMPTTTIVAVDATSGAVSVLVTFEGLGVADLDASGQHLVIATPDTLILDGTELPIDYAVIDISW